LNLLLIRYLVIWLLNHGSAAIDRTRRCLHPLTGLLAWTDHIIANGGPFIVALMLACIVLLLYYLLLLPIYHLSELVGSGCVRCMAVLVGHRPEGPAHHHDLVT